MKTLKVMGFVVCLLATLSLVGVNATPVKYLKQVNMVYWTSLDPTTYGVPGNQVSNFKLTLDHSADTWYYLNIKFLKPDLVVNMYRFYLTSYSSPTFVNYWDAKGVNSGATDWTTWQYYMWKIINHETGYPLFYLWVKGDGTVMLVDGLQYMASGTALYNPLRLNGDYPPGTYTFTCISQYKEMNGVTMVITIK